MYTMITGATGGLGSALARVLAKDGKRLLLVARNDEALRKLSESLPGNHELFCCDLSDPVKIQELEAFTLDKKLGSPAVLVNCAGSGLFGRLDELDTEKIKDSLLSNLLPVILPCQAFLKDMKRAGGVIINVMSTAALKGKAGESVYCAAKWGVRGFTESLREEAKGSSLRIVAVYPAGMATDFWQGTDVDYPVDTFMSAEDAASMIAGALGQAEKGYISDITLSR
ncbi:SDR family oxidoreductase [Endozoicomonadaceae bacterium StTr2]